MGKELPAKVEVPYFTPQTSFGLSGKDNGAHGVFPPLSSPSWRPRLKTPVLLPERIDRLRPEASKAAATQQLVPPPPLLCIPSALATQPYFALH